MGHLFMFKGQLPHYWFVKCLVIVHATQRVTSKQTYTKNKATTRLRKHFPSHFNKLRTVYAPHDNVFSGFIH